MTDENPQAFGVRVTVGTGKTKTAIGAVADWVNAGRGSVVYAVPTHVLAEEVAARFENETSLSVRVWRGRSAPNPETGTPMCDDSDSADAGATKILA